MADRDRTSQSTGQTQDRTSQSTVSKQQRPSPTPSGGGGGGGGGNSKRGSGGGGGSKANDEAQQKKTQAQLDNTAANYKKRKGDIDKVTKGRKKDLEKTAAERQADMDKIAQKQLGNIQQQRDANKAALQTNQANIMKQVNWQPNQQKEQSTLMAMRNRMGNAAYGSGLVDLAEGMQRVDDMNDVELINAWKQNEDAAYSNWFQSEQSLISDYNDQIASIEDEYSQFRADYADQMSKLKRDYQDEISQLYSQYWSTMSNVNPELATAKNLKKAARNAAGTSKTAKAVETAKAAQKLIQETGAKVATKKTASAKGKKATAAQKKAASIIGKVVSEAKTDKQKANIIKAANKAAKIAVDKAKEANRVSVGEKTDQYYLPNVNLTKKANLKSNLNIAPSSALQKLLTTQGNAKSQNDHTAAYIRPDKASALGGTINTSRAANQDFNDNLAAFRR